MTGGRPQRCRAQHVPSPSIGLLHWSIGVAPRPEVPCSVLNERAFARERLCAAAATKPAPARRFDPALGLASPHGIEGSVQFLAGPKGPSLCDHRCTMNTSFASPTITSERGVERLVTGQATSDGDGVKLTRVLTRRCSSGSTRS